MTSASMALSDSPRVSGRDQRSRPPGRNQAGLRPSLGWAGAAQPAGQRHCRGPAAFEPTRLLHPTLTALLDGVVSVAADNDLSTILSTSRTEEDEASAYRRFMNGREADGMIVASAAVADANVIGLARSGYPIVIVGRAPHVASGGNGRPRRRGGGEVATRHLLEIHGVRRVAHISGPLGHQSAQDKLTGYRNALMASAIAPDPALEVEGDYSDESGAQAVEKPGATGHTVRGYFRRQRPDGARRPGRAS